MPLLWYQHLPFCDSVSLETLGTTRNRHRTNQVLQRLCGIAPVALLLCMLTLVTCAVTCCKCMHLSYWVDIIMKWNGRIGWHLSDTRNSCNYQNTLMMQNIGFETSLKKSCRYLPWNGARSRLVNAEISALNAPGKAELFDIFVFDFAFI